MNVYSVEDFIGTLEQAALRRGDLVVARHALSYRECSTALLRIASKNISPHAPIFLLHAGIHGDERAGPLTIAKYFDVIVDAIHGRGFRLILYPLANPSGFARGTRYNADNDAGAVGNADFVRYERRDGTWTDDLASGEEAVRWRWASDEKLGVRLPRETAVLHRLLQADPLGQVRVALDLHQDLLTPGLPASAYHYSFGDLSRYEPIIEKIAQLIPVLRGVPLGAGFGVRIDENGRVLGAPDPERAIVTDELGFIVRHDGAFSDLCFRHGVPFSITAETTGATPEGVAAEVYLAWIHGLLSLAT